MNLMLDSSTAIAACGSDRGASSEVCRRAAADGWRLLVTPYIILEIENNLSHLPEGGLGRWGSLKRKVVVVPDILAIEQPVVFDAAKDRPILFSALAWADILLTLDRGDFQTLLGNQFYGLKIMTPGAFLHSLR